MILKKYKNSLLDIIHSSDLDATLFSAHDRIISVGEEESFAIELRNSPMLYAIRPHYSSLHMFRRHYSDFALGFPLRGTDKGLTFEEISADFSKWLNNVVADYLEDLSTLDRWQMLERTHSDAMREIQELDYSVPFSKEEKRQLKQSIDELRLLITDRFDVQEKQLGAITNLLEHLSDALDKQSKFDWRGIAINVATTIALHLALNPEQSRQLFELFQAAFSNIIYLLP
jgi:hypothetical protein